MRKALLTLAALATLGGCSEAKKGFDAGFDKSFRESCVPAATAKGVPAAAATRMCDCALQKINQQFTAAEKASPPGDKINPIMNECVKSVVQKNG